MGCESVDEYFAKLNGVKYSHTGDAGSGIPLIWKQIVEQYNNPPIVLVERDIEPILEFGRKIGTLDWVLPLQEAINDMTESYPFVMRVKFEEINERLPEIWRYCVSGYSFDCQRADLYKQMNIQRNFARYADPKMLEKLKIVMRSL